MTFKQEVYNHFLQLVDEKISRLQKVLNDLKESGANETKSTAGDKYETALAMLQIEQANTRAQLQDVLQQKAALVKIDPLIIPIAAVNGSLLHTSQGFLFLSAALGKSVVNGITVTALSPQSPLGKQLLHLQKGQSATVNNRQYLIESIA